jgi:ribosomal protein S12 methylthiotransferase accessory factor
LLAGLQEVVERHATMVWWLNGHPLPAVDPTPEMRRMVSAKGIRSWLIYLPNEFNIPVLAGVVENTAESLLTVGFAARPDARQAALKAWSEALILQDLSRDLQNPEGNYRHAISSGRLAAGELKPWRADRNYLDSYRADFRDIVNLVCQCQFHLDPRAQELARPFLEVGEELSFADLPSLAGGDLRVCRDAVESQGYEIFYADITTPDITAAGLVVTRTLVPGLVPNFPAAFPFLGRGAIAQGAVKLGWQSSPLAAEELNMVPLPHA